MWSTSVRLVINGRKEGIKTGFRFCVDCMLWFVFPPPAQTGVLQRCAGHRGVLYGEGGHSGPKRQQLLLQVQHRQRPYNLAKWGTFMSWFHLVFCLTPAQTASSCLPLQIIEMGCFRELNIFGPSGSRSPDLDWSQAPDPPRHPKRNLLHRIFRRHVRTRCCCCCCFSNRVH